MIGGFRKGLDIAHKIAIGVAFFCGVTFFGAGQAGPVLDSTAKERYERLKDQSDAATKLSLAARITNEQSQETQNVHELFNSIQRAVKDDMDLDYNFSEYPIPYRRMGDSHDWQIQMKSWEHKRLRFFVERRVKELREAIESNQHLAGRARVLQDGIFDMTARLKLTQEQKREAEDQYEKALDTLADGAKDITFHPLSDALNSAGFPALPGDIVKEIYNSAASRMAREFSEPLADALFRSDEIPKIELVNKFSTVAERAVFDKDSLPRSVSEPTYSDRLQEKERRDIPAKAVEKAVREK